MNQFLHSFCLETVEKIFYGGSVVKKKKKANAPSEFSKEYTVSKALVKGDIFTKLSFLIMGLGNIVRKQFIKGLLFLAVEVGFIYFMVAYGIQNLSMLPSLGDREGGLQLDPTGQFYEYVAGDDSKLILLYGVVSAVICVAFFLFWRETVKSAYMAEVLKKKGKPVKTFVEDVKSLFDVNLHKLLLALPIIGVVAFTILPLIYMILMAFTNYSKVNDHLVLFDWVGLKNFGEIVSLKSSIGKQFWSVTGWTIVWAILATFLNYILGMLLAIIINRKGTKLKGMWRFIFILSIAIPQFVSLLIIRTLFADEGPINLILKTNHVITNSVHFLSDATLARVMVVLINLWIGIPYTMLQVTGILQNIPTDLYEAAKVDGANAVTTFFKITLPYMLFVTGPYLVTTFTGNINNFNVIFLLTGGAPIKVGNSAGQTDLLVTWLYKLTISENRYNVGAVIGIMTFIVLAIVSIVTYRNTAAYKDEEGFQ